MIEVTNLTKNYGALQAVKDISFGVKKGEVLGFLGPNGAGKTTVMRILTCFMPATAGEVLIGGYDVMRDSFKVRELFGYLPETVPLYNDLTVKEYLGFAGRAKRLSGKDVKKTMDRTIDECGLEPVAGRMIRKLSKGFRQRVGLAQALIGDPQILILDEPTIGLDPKQIIEIREMIKNIGKERTVILSTHILPEVSMTCQRVIIINEGRIVAEDTPESLTLELQQSNRVLVTAVGDKSQMENILRSVPGVSRVSMLSELDNQVYKFMVESPVERDIRAEIAKRLVQNQFGLLGIKAEEMTLEDIFIKLVTSEQEVDA
jgi:ABC-2 type transport system ATP-binding protein